MTIVTLSNLIFSLNLRRARNTKKRKHLHKRILHPLPDLLQQIQKLLPTITFLLLLDHKETSLIVMKKFLQTKLRRVALC